MSTIFSKLLLLMLFPLIFLPKGDEKKHPFHVSTTEISYNAKGKTLEITCRIFTDDFENALSQRFKSKIDLYAKNREKEMSGFIKNYIETNLKIVVDGKMVKPNFLGFENDHEATNVYLEVEKLSSFKTLAANNGILYDLFDDQMNILHVEKNGARKSTKASFPEKKMSVVF